MACVDSGALSPVAPRQRLSEQKALSPRGLQNVSPHSEMPDVLSGLFRHHTLLNLSDYTRLCAGAQPVPNSTISLPPRRPLSEERGGRKVTQTSFSGEKLPSPRVLNKATLAGIMLNYPAKNPINPGAALGKPRGADKSLEPRTNSSSLAERRACSTLLLLFIYFSGHILFSFNLFINAGIKEVSAEFGGGLPKDYIAVSKPDTCLWLPEKQQCETRIELTTIRSHLPPSVPSPAFLHFVTYRVKCQGSRLLHRFVNPGKCGQQNKKHN